MEGHSAAVDDGWKALHNPINSQQMSKNETHTVEEKTLTFMSFECCLTERQTDALTVVLVCMQTY